MSPWVIALQEKLGHPFQKPRLLVRALTHRSRSSELPPTPENADNEQLEFLGDSVLGFIVSEALVARYPLAREGQLSQLKAHLVSSEHLYRCALNLGLGEYLLLGKGEERNGGRERKTLLSDAVEAILAAIHLDGGIDAARQFVQTHILNAPEMDPDIDAVAALNYKSALQEKLQSLGLPPPRYVTVDASGPEHAKVFLVEARVSDQLTAQANGTSKKAASQQAARRLIEQLAQS